MKVNIFYPLGHDEYLGLRSQLKPNELDIYLYLITKHPFKDSKIEIDTALISEQLGYHRRTVQLAINKLVSLNILEVEITRFKYRQARIITQDSESVDRQSESVDRQSESVDRQSESVDRQSESVDRQSESVDRFRRTEPAPSKASEVPHTIQTNSDLKNTTEAANCCVLEKFKDKLHFYQVYLEIYDQASNSVIPNPKIATIRKIIQGMPAERAERAIAAFLAWLPNAKNVRCKYAAFASSLRENWQT